MADWIEGLEPGMAEGEPDAATLAFESLTGEVADVRAELSVLRRAVEALGPALSEGRPPDYSPTLAQIAQQQAALGSHIERMEKHPALQIGPEAFAARVSHAIEQAGRGVLRDAEHTAQAIRGAAREVEAVLNSARTRAHQNRRLLQAAVIGLGAGLVLFPLIGFPLARGLPFGSLPDSLAASALGEDRWSAGMGLMMRANPGQWNGLVEGWRRAEAAGEELKSCFDAASRTGKEQKCSLSIRPPLQPGRQ